MIRILCGSEQPLLGAGLEAVLSCCQHCEVKRAPLAPEEWLKAVEEGRPQVAVLEWGGSGDWNPVESLRQAAPDCRVVVLLRNLMPETLFQAREAGVAGALSVQATPEELMDAIRRVVQGEFVFDQSVEWPRGTRRIRLTKRESDLVCLLVQGLKNKEIAAALGLTEGTVKVYLCKLFQKVGAKDRFELALFGLRNLSYNNGDGAAAHKKQDGKETRLRSLVISSQDQDRARLSA